MRRLMSFSGLACAGAVTLFCPPVCAEGFVEDSHASLALRNYYFNDDYRDGGNDRREWAQGLLLNLHSGYTPGAIGFGVDALGLSGIRLDSTPEHAGTGLLPVHDDGHAAGEYSSLGLTAKVRWGDVLIKSGTLLPKIPVLVHNDGRLLPQTFRGTQVEYSGIDRLYLHAGHLDEFKARNSSDSVDIYPQGYTGSQGTDFDFAGATYNLTKNLSATWYFGEMREFYQQQFLGLVYKQTVGPGTLTTDLRYFTSKEAGAARNGEVDSDMFSGLFTYRLGGHSLGLGYQKVYGNTALPYVSVGTVYSFSNASNGKFIQPGEQTWMLRYDYDFSALGIPGLSFMTRYYKGDDGEYRGGLAREHELNSFLKYVVQGGALKGLGLEYRSAVARSTYASDRNDNRFYLTYTFSLW